MSRLLALAVTATLVVSYLFQPVSAQMPGDRVRLNGQAAPGASATN